MGRLPVFAGLDDVLGRIEAAAGQRDRHSEGLRREIGWLHAAGLLEAR